MYAIRSYYASRCEWACYDTQETCYSLTMHYQDEIHRPAFPYKFKFKFSGCPNDCVASIARSDIAVIGTWKDQIRIDQAAVKGYIAGSYPSNGGAHAGKDWGKFDIQAEVIDLCPRITSYNVCYTKLLRSVTAENISGYHGNTRWACQYFQKRIKGLFKEDRQSG